jgi:hypothetical protein
MKVAVFMKRKEFTEQPSNDQLLYKNSASVSYLEQTETERERMYYRKLEKII